MCRRWSGGPVFATPVQSVTFEGADKLARYSSSDWAERGFCKLCGSHLFYYLKPNDQYFMCVGAFEESARFRLASELYVDRKPPGYALAGDLVRLTEADVLAKYSG
jgi:hypothetical protein